MTMAGSSPIPAGGWKVTGQMPKSVPSSGGKLVPGYEITFVTSNNVTSSIWVPNTSYDPTDIRGLIMAQVEKLDAVSTMSHP